LLAYPTKFNIFVRSLDEGGEQQAGVTAVSIGANDGSTPPQVPKAFEWVDVESGTSLMGLFNWPVIQSCLFVWLFAVNTSFPIRCDAKSPLLVRDAIRGLNQILELILEFSPRSIDSGGECREDSNESDPFPALSSNESDTIDQFQL
jgi:hypothetical protein